VRVRRVLPWVLRVLIITRFTGRQWKRGIIPGTGREALLPVLKEFRVYS